MNELLYRKSGFLSYLIVVFLNAFTDLGHKIIIQNTVFKVYDGSLQIVLTAIVNALILLPFVLVFSPSGFLSDKYPKNKIMQYSAFLAVIITLCITMFYYLGWFYAAFFMTFLLALQSAIYSPAKYGYIKELVGEKYLSSANGAVQAVTTVSILSGIMFYTVLFELNLNDHFQTKEEVLRQIAPLGWLLVGGSIIEYLLTLKLPTKVVLQAHKRFSLNKYFKGYYLFKNLKLLHRKKEVWDNIVVLSLFWSISQVILAIFGEYAKAHIGITNAIYVQGIMALSGIGIVVGSIIAAKLSKYFINVGIATIGAVGIALIVFLIPFIISISLLASLFFLFGICSGFILVPLNANIQYITPNVHLGTIIAGNNFIQNIFMITFLILTTIFAYFGMDAQMLFLLMGLIALYMVYRLFKQYLVMSFWAFVTIILSIRYKVIYEGLELIPKHKGVLFLGNHISWLDWYFLQAPIEKRIFFLIDKEIYHRKYFYPILQYGSLLPLSPKGFKEAMKQAANELKQHHYVALFPEGAIAKNCKMGMFHRGFELLERFEWDGVIVPFKIDGIQGSIFSRCRKERSFFHRRVIKVRFYPPCEKKLQAQELEMLLKEENVK